MADELTPMMRQYRRMKGEIPGDALLLFRLGDFYEMFFEDAKAGAELLGLTLTKRNGVPMCGVPYHAAENYIGKLVQAGRRVAVCEQTTEPKPGQLVEREVTQILTPGSAGQLNLTQPKENRFLAAVAPADGRYGLACVDLSTGEFRVAELETLRQWQEEMLRLQPKELIYPEEAVCPELPDLRPAKVAHDGWAFEPGQARLVLLEHFKMQSLDGFGCEGMALGQAAAGALLHYVTQTLRHTAAHVLRLRPQVHGEGLVLDAVTQRNLELVEGLSGASGDTSLLKAMDHTVTAMGGRELRQWILRPLRNKAAIEARQLVVARFLEEAGHLDRLRELLQGVRDLQRLAGRLTQGGGNARDLLALRASLEPLPELKALADRLDAPLARELGGRLTPQPELLDTIALAIVDEPPAGVKEGGMIREGFHAEVDELRRASRDGKSWLAELQAREQGRTGIKSLKVRYNQVFGYYIEITKSNLGQVPDDYQRKQTLVNAERFVTPELKEMESKILGAEERLRQLEYEVFQELRGRVAGRVGPLLETAGALAELDVLGAFATLARLYHYARPRFNEQGRLVVEDGRHPVLEQRAEGEKFVPNDASLNNEDCRLVILTGPNMAGKSTYIRQVALIALMAHLGSYVPARRADVPLLDRIFTRVGANDDLSRGQSTFMVEMNETANILNNATADSLVILDEIGRGTSTFDGLSIAWAVAEHLHGVIRAKTLFATHYHELTELAVSMKGVRNFNVAVREWHDQIIFLRKIVPGGTDKSYGIQVARLAGLPRDVIHRAKEILRNLEENELDATGQPQLAAHREGKGGARPVKKSKKNGEPPQLDLFKHLAARSGGGAEGA